MPFEILLKGLNNSQKGIGTDKGLAKIGDAIVNLAYSVAKSLYLTKRNKSQKGLRTGNKVNQTILSNALKNSNLKNFARTRANAHDIADSAEAIFAYIWIQKKMTLDEMIEFLAKELTGDLINHSEETLSATQAFTKLLEYIKRFLPET